MTMPPTRWKWKFFVLFDFFSTFFCGLAIIYLFINKRKVFKPKPTNRKKKLCINLIFTFEKVGAELLSETERGIKGERERESEIDYITNLKCQRSVDVDHVQCGRRWQSTWLSYFPKSKQQRIESRFKFKGYTLLCNC